jgi:hypothetical protein
MKGQFLFPLSTMGSAVETIKKPMRPGVDRYDIRTVYKSFFNSAHRGWEFLASNRDTSINAKIISGEKWTEKYVMTIYYTSPDVGIVANDYYINYPDVCTFDSTQIAIDSLLYVEVFQRKDVAISQQSCKPATVPYTTMTEAGVFVNTDFGHNDLLYTADRKFTAFYSFQKPLVKLTVATNQLEWNSYVFVIPRINKPPLQYWLRSGESCYYFLPQSEARGLPTMSVFV